MQLLFTLILKVTSRNPATINQYYSSTYSRFMGCYTNLKSAMEMRRWEDERIVCNTVLLLPFWIQHNVHIEIHSEKIPQLRFSIVTRRSKRSRRSENRSQVSELRMGQIRTERTSRRCLFLHLIRPPPSYLCRPVRLPHRNRGQHPAFDIQRLFLAVENAVPRLAGFSSASSWKSVCSPNGHCPSYHRLKTHNHDYRFCDKWCGNRLSFVRLRDAKKAAREQIGESVTIFSNKTGDIVCFAPASGYCPPWLSCERTKYTQNPEKSPESCHLQYRVCRHE